MTTSLPLVQRAHYLADEIVTRHGSHTSLNRLPDDAFMTHRPNSLHESYTHGRSVAVILAHWHAAEELQAAGLLHSFVCRDVVSTQEIAEACNDRVAFLCSKYAEILLQNPETVWHGRSQVIKRVKLYMAAYCDLALAFIGVASLWDHFLHAQRSDSVLQRYFANEAQEIMIPLLDILGMQKLKTDVEDWIMHHTKNRKDYETVVKRLDQSEDMRQLAFKQVYQRLQSVLLDAEINYKRPTLTEIHNPDHPEKVNHEALQKLRVNIQVSTEEACYHAFRWIHTLWQPVDNSVIDTINVSKLNGYRALQTTVIVAVNQQRIKAEFTIYTPMMNKINTWGIAALEMQERCQVDVPHAWWSAQKEGHKNIQQAKIGALPDILYVFSPQGQLFRFARGCTVVDYAYHVHSEVAHQSRRFRINGEVVGPATTLHHLDLVELERDPQFAGPNQAWLNAAHTSRARSHIERFLNRQRQGQMTGKTVINSRLRELSDHYRIDIPNHRVQQQLRKFSERNNNERIEDLLGEIGAGRVHPDPILHPLFSDEIARQIVLPPNAQLRPRQINLAQCCRPRPGDDIIGRPRYKNEKIVRLKIHQTNCQHIANQPGGIPLKWRLQPRLNTVARLEVTALAKDNLLKDALQIFGQHRPHLSLHKVYAVTRNGTARLSFTIEAKDQALIDDIIKNLKTLPDHNINQVRQMQLSFMEREELATLARPTVFNPYRRQPVENRDMFFGRTQELNQVKEMLRTGAGTMFIQGQKRVGKTSLLLYLKKHYLSRQSKMPVFIDFQLLSHLSGPNFHYEIASAVFSDLQTDNQINYLDPPLQELFARDPARHLIEYLKYIQSHLGARKLILLIDEFSRIIDAYQQGRIDDTVFHQWRGVIQTTIPQISYIMVVQQQSYNHLQKHVDQGALTPIWHLLELGETIQLHPLKEKDAHQLIERPTLNHFEYSSDALRYVWRLTGGNPFLIHAFCYNLVRHMSKTGRRQVELSDVETVQFQFMRPQEPIFAHLLNVIQNIPHATDICKELTASVIDTAMPWARLKQALPQINQEALQNSLQKLTQHHILVEPQPDCWQITSLLFGRWLAANSLLV